MFFIVAVVANDKSDETQHAFRDTKHRAIWSYCNLRCEYCYKIL